MSEPAKWQQVWNLHQAGYTNRQIAFNMDIADSSVRVYLSEARRRLIRTGEMAEWERQASEMASVYPDEARRKWIWERMRRWAGQ